MTLADRVKQLRRTKNLNMTELADKAGITPEYVSMIESGARTPSFSVVRKIAKAFKMTAGDFMEGVR